MEITMSCERRDSGWVCAVTVGDDPAATRHHVTLTEDLLARLASGQTAEDLVRASFEFLLEREPREAILSHFELPVITRYFPEWERAMEERLGA